MNSLGPVLLGLVALALLAGPAVAQPTPTRVLDAAVPAPALYPPEVPADLDVDSGDACHDGWVAGAGLYLILPYFQNNTAYTVLQENNGVSPSFIRADRVDISHHVGAAPLVWLGYLGEGGVGGRVRYWYFRQGTDQAFHAPPFVGTFDPIDVKTTSGTQVTITSAAPLGLQAFGDTVSKIHGPEATTLAVTSKLEVQVLDLEAVSAWGEGGWDFLLAGGVRLARLDQTYNAYDWQSSSLRELRTLLSSNTFQGGGPVLAAEVRRAVGEGGWGVYGSGRGALVFGSGQQRATFGGEVLRNNDPNPQSAAQHRDGWLPIAELELGLDREQLVGPCRLFGRVGVVGQHWFGAGSASRSVLLTPPHSPNPVLGGAAVDSDLSFLGLAIRVGVNY